MDSAARRFACTLKFDPNPTSAYTFSGIDGRGFVSVTRPDYSSAWRFARPRCDDVHVPTCSIYIYIRVS